MKQVLGSKHHTTNQQWLDAIANIESLVSVDEVSAYAERATERIRSAVHGKHAAYAWSGGKDSIVLADLCAAAGVTEGYFAYCDLDYPAFVRWCAQYKPTGVEMMHTGHGPTCHGLDLLVEHPELIFARGAVGQRWHQISQRRPFSRMFFDHKLDVLLVGHRKIDGNVCGQDFTIRKNTGETRYAPIADWPHEVLLGYIHYHGLALPPIYGWKDGFIQGTHAWPERDFCDTLEQGYREVYEIDPSIIVKAAKKLPSAAAFLKEVSA